MAEQETRVFYFRAFVTFFALVLCIPLMLSLPNLRYDSYFEKWRNEATNFIAYSVVAIIIVLFVQLSYKFWLTTEPISCFFLLLIYIICISASVNALSAYLEV